MTFDNDRAMRAVKFISLLKHTKGQWAGKPFDLLPWQHQIISDVYGTLDDKGRRQYQYVYLEIPKKNGKSELGAGIGLYHLFADGEKNGEIYGCAADRAQASLVFDVAVDMIDQCPALKKRCKLTLSQKMMTDRVSGSKYKVLSSEAYSKHGLNASCVIFDELHAQPNRELWDVMTVGAGDARESPIWFVITTAGDDPDRQSIGWEIHERARDILAGERMDPRWYSRIWGVEPEFTGDIYDEELWYRVNPSLGSVIDIDKVRQHAIAAKCSAQEEMNFRWLRLNQWVSLKHVGWLPVTLWDDTTRDFTRTDMLGRECYVGIDLSTTTDLTAITCLFPPEENGEWRFFTDAWIPEDMMREREKNDRVPFIKWAREEHVHATPGGVVDYGYLAAHLKKLALDYRVKFYCGDPWHLEMLRQLLPVDDQEKFIQITQTMAGMSAGMHELERMFREGTVAHPANPCGRWCFGNTAVAIDGNENKKPMKNKSRGRIDMTVSLINAMAGAIKLEQKKSVYEDRGLRVI